MHVFVCVFLHVFMCPSLTYTYTSDSDNYTSSSGCRESALKLSEYNVHIMLLHNLVMTQETLSLNIEIESPIYN